MTSDAPHQVMPDRRQWVGLIIGMLAAALILFGTVTLFAVRATQVANTKKTNANVEALVLVKDCVEPQGQCFKDGQARTAKAVGDIGKANAIAAAAASTCAVRLPHATFSRVYECTVRNVEKAQKRQGR